MSGTRDPFAGGDVAGWRVEVVADERLDSQAVEKKVKLGGALTANTANDRNSDVASRPFKGRSRRTKPPALVENYLDTGLGPVYLC